jgi:thioredoxin-like negative regulator of GroEL
MGLLGRRKIYDRKVLLTEARDAQRRGKHKKAVALLRRILCVEPNNAEIHAMIAPSLAERRLRFDAWQSYTYTAQVLIRDGKKQAALSVYADASKRMPGEFEVWIAKSELELSMGGRAEASRTLGSALPHFRKRATRYPLIALLRRRLTIDPEDMETTLELASNLSRTGQKDEAKMHLSKLAEASVGRLLRQVRRSQWSIEPSLAHSWLWLRSCVASS